MHSNTRSHASSFGLSWGPANVALTILLTLLFLIFLLLFMTLTATQAQAQNSAMPMWGQKVPATATEAAAIPQFAARLGRPVPAASPANASRVVSPAKMHVAHTSTAPACSQTPVQPRWLPDDTVVYSNGPINGTTDAWTINFGFVTSDSFTVPIGGSGVTGMTFGAWLFPGDVLQTVEVSITSSEFGGTTYFDQVVSFSQSGCSVNQYGYNVCTEAGTFTVSNLNQGTYWVNLQNATVANGDPVYWDENSGPSSASENSVGTIPSEAFTVLGGSNTNCPPSGCPPPAPCYHSDGHIEIIHDFTTSDGWSNGITTDTRGNVYGTTSGGDYGAGMIYRLAQRGQDWMFTPLYSFTGGANGSGPSPVIVGPDGALYGSASGGRQNCGQDGTSYCGVIFRLRPFPVACTTALCGWHEDVVYEFPGNEGGGPGGLTSIDQSGNFYGVLALPNGVGIFELTPSAGGWTESVIYTFLGGTDGSGAGSLLVGPDGNLYGLTPDGGDLSCGYGGSGCGTAFQLVPSGNNWTKNIIYTFEADSNGYAPRPGQLNADGAGNLYGVATTAIVDHNWCPAQTSYVEFVFGLSRANGQWVYRVLSGDFELDVFTYINLTTDSSGHFYDTTEAIKDYIWFDGGGLHEVPYYYYGEVFGSDGSDWFSGYSPYYVFFEPKSITVDSKHIYGTTGSCGQNNKGTIWRLPH